MIGEVLERRALPVLLALEEERREEAEEHDGRRDAPLRVGSRSPIARLPTWSWFWAHATIREPSGRESSAAMRDIEPSNSA